MAAVCVSDDRRRKLRRMGGALWLLFLRDKHRRTRSIWTREWLTRREDFGAFDTLLSELREEDKGSFLNFLRLTPGIFDELLVKITPLIVRQDTHFRKSISPGLRLAVTMRFLATGETFKSLSYLFRVSNNTIGLIVPDTCKAIHAVLKDEYFKCPTTEEEWRSIAAEYQAIWNFPNCIGSLDGKHVTIRKPACSGSMFFNYKNSFSVVLLALVDAQYRFLFCDIGAQGRCSDAGIFMECDLNEALNDNTLGIPPPQALPGTNREFPFVIVADDAFPLRQNIMKPYPHRNLPHHQRIFNYRLSRARRCVENAFGIMSARFRVMLSPMCLGIKKIDAIIIACCTLHNMLRTLVPNRYIARTEEATDPNTPTLGATTNELPQARVSGRRSVTQVGKQLRDVLCAYFNSQTGAVGWQESMI